MSKKLVIIDGYSLANRAFFVPQFQTLATSLGQPTGAVYGMARMILKLLKDLKPDYLLTAFDVAAPTFRHQEYQEYKGQRMKMEDSLKSQMPIIRELFEILKVPIYEMSGYEADDLIGTYAKVAVKLDLDVEIITGDRDSFQLVEPGIKILYTRKGISELDFVDNSFIQERYQLRPEQLIDLKGLMGDSSDNIPGIPGFGEKTALKYLHQFGSLEAIYEQIDTIQKPRDRELFITYREQAYLSRKLATIITDLEVNLDLDLCCQHQDYNQQQLIDFFSKYEFSSLVKEYSGAVQSVEIRQIELLPYTFDILNESNIDKAITEIEEQSYCYIQFLTSEATWQQVKVVGLGLATSQNNWFYPIKLGEKFPEKLTSLLSNSQILKIGHDLKKQLIISSGLGIQLGGEIEDILIAGYLVNAGQGGLELEQLSETHLQKAIPAYRNERGKIFSVFSLPEDLPTKVLSEIAGGRLEALKHLRGKIAAIMESSQLKSLYVEVELPLIQVLFQMERDGIKVESEILKNFGGVLRKRQQELETEIYTLVDQQFNISSPKQLGTILFEKLGLKAPKKNKTGYSTDAEVLEALVDRASHHSEDFGISSKLKTSNNLY